MAIDRGVKRDGAWYLLSLRLTPVVPYFLINLGTATASDIETLGETVRQRVKASCGVELEWEIKRIGLAKV